MTLHTPQGSLDDRNQCPRTQGLQIIKIFIFADDLDNWPKAQIPFLCDGGYGDGDGVGDGGDNGNGGYGDW